MSIKNFLFFFLAFYCIITPISRIIDHYGKFSKKSGKNKDKLRPYTLKAMKILRTASLGSNFTGSYKKKVQSPDTEKSKTFNNRKVNGRIY